MDETKKVIKKYVLYGVLLVMLIFTVLSSASGYSLDSVEDSYVVSPGTLIEGHFIIVDYTQVIKIESDFDWLSFSEDRDVKVLDKIDGKRIGDTGISIPYYISVPDDADIGIYRTAIRTNSLIDTQYLNIKVNVQNSFFSNTQNWFNSMGKSSKYIGFFTLMLIFGIIIFFLRKSVIGGKNG